ncbi:hypothetical protein JKF63_03820 [Porcisia hertigi]|uniref:Fungal lipase-type domain-containing protein n=1 Tax=Porcisia hertigi TaxID=2761500 RepID=A0A836L3P5_9TRYP|nr:hypothetical protein JKF63_03820 [Porcisia hertigi]
MLYKYCAILVVVTALLLVCDSALAVFWPGEYSPVDARRSLHYANATFADIGALESWQCGASCQATPSFQVTSILERNGAQGPLAFVGVDKSNAQVVVALRGGVPQKDWFMHWRVKPVLFDITSLCGLQCKVDASFQNGYLALRRGIRAAVVRDLRENPGYDVLVTGHSFGAALAQLAAIDLQAHVNRMFFVSKPVVSLYTFGMPLVGNRDFAVWAKQMLVRGSHFRITRGHDPVPRTPLHGMVDFQHVSSEVHCPDKVTTTCHVSVDDSGKSADVGMRGAHRRGVKMQDHFLYFE